MVDEIKLFRSMVKNHATIIGWLIKNKKVENVDGKLVLYTQKEVKPEYIQTYTGDYRINPDGSKELSSFNLGKDFTRIRLLDDRLSEIVGDGFEIFNTATSSQKYCLTSQVGQLLLRHYDILGEINFNKDYPRLKGEEALAYIKWMENKHDYLRKHDFRFTLWGNGICEGGYIGADGNSSANQSVIDNIQRFGIFAYKPIYKEIEWTFDLVEKYKDQIVWERLMDDSNLFWNEDVLVKYDKYIPYQLYENRPKYSYYENSSRVFTKYENLGFLSNAFLREHINILDWEKVLEECDFSWDKDELDFFCSYVLEHNNGPDHNAIYDVEGLLKNEFFNWDADKLYVYLQLNDYFWDIIKKHKHLHKYFMQIPNVKELAKPYIKDEKFWDIVSYNRDYDYDELSNEFTIENIKKNVSNWSTPLKNKFLTMHRTPDTNYSYYWVITKWDIMYTHKNVPLTYEIAKYLQFIDITIGGTYCASDGGYIEEDHRNMVVNGLEFFTNHHFESEEDVIKVINDVDLLDFFLKKSCNEDLVPYMARIFFSKTSLQEYLDIVNEMKDWDTICVFND